MVTKGNDKTDSAERNRLLGQARQAATQIVLTNHREEFEGAYVAEAAARGVDYKPRPTKKDRDREQLLQLLQDNPELREELLKGE